MNASTRTTRIALLKCGDLKGKAYEQNGGYNEIYHSWLQLSRPNHTFVLDSYDVVQEEVGYPNEDLYDCIMLTGSGTIVHSTVLQIVTYS